MDYEELKKNLLDFDKIKDKIIMRLVNTDYNRENILHRPHRSFYDLTVTYLVAISCDESGMTSVPVTDEIMELWKVTEDMLYGMALTNTNRVCPAMIRSMGEMLVILGMWCPGTDLPDGNLYVLSNIYGNFGASSVMVPGVLKDAAEQIGDDFWVLPSSIHEVILAPAYLAVDAGELEAMVRDINEREVRPDEVLGNHVYYYDRDCDELRLVLQ